MYPHSSDLIDYEIVLTFVQMNESFYEFDDGVYVYAGEIIGTGTESPCQPNYMHMAIRYRNSSYGEVIPNLSFIMQHILIITS